MKGRKPMREESPAYAEENDRNVAGLSVRITAQHCQKLTKALPDCLCVQARRRCLHRFTNLEPPRQ